MISLSVFVSEFLAHAPQFKLWEDNNSDMMSGGVKK